MATLIYGQLVNGCYRLLKLIQKLTSHFTHAIWISFIMFCLLCISCRQPDVPASVVVVKKNERATGIVINGLKTAESEIKESVAIQLVHPGERTSVLGEFKTVNGEVVFEPLVPFTPGLQYEVLLNNLIFATFEIPDVEFDAPELLSIYPSQDTLPENLLKIYLHFSQPMVEGRSLTYLTLIENERDTLQGTFLDLQPELWNSEGTMLTLWLDPGRIKRDLIPNRNLGAPLTEGNEYTLVISASWKSKTGNRLSKNYSKTFLTTYRDDRVPDPLEWKITVPVSGTKQFLKVQFPETLDYNILHEGLQLVNSEGHPVSGTKQITNEEQVVKFFPDESWNKGTFALKIEGRLEDLAGNNLKRPFERDVRKKTSELHQEIFTREFDIK